MNLGEIVKSSVSIITSYAFDELLEKEARAQGKTKSALVDEIVRTYLEKIKNNNVELRRYSLAPRDRCFLSIKLSLDLNREVKHQAVMHNVCKQDIFNQAFSEYFRRKK